MKNNILFLVTILVLLNSCRKEPITPGNYGIEPEKEDTTGWQSNYVDGGATPNSGWTTQVVKNKANGTSWVLIDVYHNYAHVDKNDTVHFITNTKYTIGSDTTTYTYSLYTTMGNSTLTFNQFSPINGLYLSASNFYENVFKTTPSGGTIQLTLKDNFSTTNNIYTSTFKKI